MEWFHSNITSREAINLLMKNGDDGSFLVRHSESVAQNYTLVVRRCGSVHHVTIQNEGDGYNVKGGNTFSSLARLVENALKNPFCDESNVPIILKEPLKLKKSTNEIWYHGNINGSVAKSMLLQMKEDGYFLVRDSRHSPGSLVLSVLKNKKVTHYNISLDLNDQLHVNGTSMKFDSLSKLVKYYQRYSKMTTAGESIKLGKSLNTTRFVLSNVKYRMKQLEQLSTAEEECNSKDGYTEEFDQLQRIEAEELSNGFNNSVGARKENKKKNRFKNILPFDSTRVKLIDNPDLNANDYINANYIQSDDPMLNNKKYIASQGPLKQTIADFWRMVCQENVQIIAMTTKEVENGRNKCVCYWPTSDDENVDCEVHKGVIRVTHVREEECSDYVLREFQLTQWIESEDDEDDELIQLNEPRRIFQFHFTGWPDHGVPDLTGILNYLKNINQYHQKFGGYLLVHCSAGIGRTGTIIIIDMLINEIKVKGIHSTIDIFNTVNSVRQQRSGMVQTETQYRFIYQAVEKFLQISNSEFAKLNEDEVYNNEVEDS